VRVGGKGLIERFESNPSGCYWLFWLDDYELTTDTTDPDDDGFQTLEEYIAGTNPTNAVSFFHINLTPNGITFASVSNRVYSVEGFILQPFQPYKREFRTPVPPLTRPCPLIIFCSCRTSFQSAST
jgi:hypothetical protein